MAITVATSATLLVDSATQDHLRQVRNNGAGSISLGRTAAVTVAGGYALASGATLQVDVKEGEQLYGITATAATADVL